MKNNTLDIYNNDKKSLAIFVINDKETAVLPLPDNCKTRRPDGRLSSFADTLDFIRASLPMLPTLDYSIPFEITIYETGRTSRDGILLDTSGPFQEWFIKSDNVSYK